jgi:hypothetical protein
MKNTIFGLLIIILCTSASLAQEKNISTDSSQVEFYSSLKDFQNKNIIHSVHITIMSVAKSTYQVSFRKAIHKAELYVHRFEDQKMFIKKPDPLIL